jgi:HSP20 family protein
LVGPAAQAWAGNPVEFEGDILSLRILNLFWRGATNLSFGPGARSSVFPLFKEVFIMSSLRLFEPRLFEPSISEPFESMFKRFMAPMRRDLESAAIEMRVDVTEVDGMYKVRADLPGVNKSDISVRIDGNMVQIEAEARKEKETKKSDGRVLCSERWHGAVSRAFTVGQDVDESKATAKYEDGVLTLELPKKEGVASKRLEVK